MGREVRRVPADWQHPRYPGDHYPPQRAGKFIPLHEGGGYVAASAAWDEAFAQWQAGFVETYRADEKWERKGADHVGRYTEYAGERPSPDDYMPEWPEAIATHFMMYEDTTEGTPISPAFSTPEELARWLADAGASSFGSDTATYEQWLAVSRGGWAPSLIIQNGVMQTGISTLHGDASQDGETA